MDPDLIARALRQVGREVRREHKLLGPPIVIWRDGKVVHVPPEEIVIDPEPGEP